MTEPTELVPWLRAVLDKEEAATRELLHWVQQTILELQDPKLLGRYIPGWGHWPEVERMCQSRLLDIDAQRRILDEHSPRRMGHFVDLRCEGCLKADPCPTVRMLALPYAEHPDYRPEWRP